MPEHPLDAPQTYAQWVVVLDAFVTMEHDEEVARALAEGRIQWGPGVAECLTKKLNDAAKARVKKLEERYNRDRKHAQGDPVALTKALLSLRRGLANTAAMLESAHGLPAEVTQALGQYVHDSADLMQSSLLDSARSDRTGRSKALLIDTPVNKF